MAINHDIVGKVLEATIHDYAWRDAVIYALGVGATAEELDYLYEARGPAVLPTFAVVPSFRSLIDVCAQLGANPLAILHGEQAIRLHRAIPPRGKLETRAQVTGIFDKGKGALAVVVAKTTNNGEPVFDNEFSLFIRGEGGFGGSRGPESAAIAPSDRDPDFCVSQATSREQAALYRLSGDLNPLHIAPEAAKVAGFDKPILHGLCTFGFAGRAIVREACAGDASRLKHFKARFSGVVFPGDTLSTSGWNTDEGWLIQVKTQDDKVVLSQGLAEVSKQ